MYLTKENKTTVANVTNTYNSNAFKGKNKCSLFLEGRGERGGVHRSGWVRTLGLSVL